MGAFDDIFYDSDDNGSLEAKETNSIYYEKAILDKLSPSVIPLVGEPKIVFISNDDIKKIKVDILKVELRK